MDVPAAVASALSDESVAARVPLRGDDALFVTPTRTIVYHADGLLSSESVEEFGHDAERIAVDDGRRKATLTLDYGLDGERSFTVPSGRVDDVLHPVLAGVLSAAGVTDSGESVSRTYHFNELTLVVTDRRLVRHVGAAVWDGDYDEIDYTDVTGFDTEEGSVASQLVLETTGRVQRIKVPNEQFRDVRETVEDALYEAHSVSSRAAFREAMREDDEDEAEADATDAETDDDTAIAFADSGIDVIGERGRERSDAAAGGNRHAPERNTTPDIVDDEEAGTVSAEDASAGTASAEDSSAETAATGDLSAETLRDDADTPGTSESVATPTDATPSEPARPSAETESSAPAAADSDDHATAVDLDALAAELEAARDALADQRDRAEAQRDTLERQRRAIDAQLDALDEQHARIEDALDAIPDR
ncbi:DUF7115 domain-containing protein [Halarchaeum salinum]|uniref:DUF7115 domain-containing protein n=1 Tax=Halarchaeum salinum TaxID=489912 RepID=A0AAV3SA45_9EURY